MKKKLHLMFISALMALFYCSCQSGERDHTAAEAAYGQAVAHYMSGDLKKAEASFRAIAVSDPAYGPARIMLGKTLFFQNRFNEAEAEWKAALQEGPAVLAYIWLSKTAMLRTNTDQAHRYLNQALALDHSNPLTHYELARFHQAAGRFEKAIYHYNFALSFDSTLMDVRLDLAALYASIGAREESARLYKNALAAPNVPASVREKISLLLAGVEKKS